MASSISTREASLAVIATAAVAVVAAMALTPAWSARASAPGSEMTDSDKKGKPKEEGKPGDGDKKLYEVKREHYSIQTGTWAEREEPDDEENADHLFIVKHRSWPKSQDFAGYMDYSEVTIKSQALIDILRRELDHIEAIFDDQPSPNAEDLFLHLDKLQASAIRRKADAERMKKAEGLNEIEVKLADLDATAIDVAVDLDASEPLDENDVDARFAKEEKTSAEIEQEVEHLEVLLKYIEELFKSTTNKLDRFKKDGVISFQLLWALFSPGTDVEMSEEVSGERMAFRLKTASYSMMRDGLVYRITGEKLTYTGVKFVKAYCETTIPKFKGMKKLSTLPARPLTDVHREELTARGRVYTELARVAFVEYSGVLFQVIGSGMERKVIKLRAEGRAVIDVKGFRRINPGRQVDWDEDDEDEEYGKSTIDVAPEEELCLLPPLVYGFSLVQREWGGMLVNQFSEVKFRADAFQKLVLNKDQKELLRSLVEQSTATSKALSVGTKEEKALIADSDLIAAKGGGLVIALHGRPGVGKTLTAEALAELLQVPLYSISAGQLGVSAGELEARLRDILDVASSWGAVMLIDEAEVFLAERSIHDLGRNALVSVFLRMLEYISGVLVLTTNQVRNIDPAFMSRFSVAITYPDLDVHSRREIWKTFLQLGGQPIDEPNGVFTKPKAAVLPTPDSSGTSSPTPEAFGEVAPRFSSKDLDTLAKKKLNGRTIKNIVRTATSLAGSQKVPVSMEHINTVVKVSEEFLSAIKDADEEGVYDAKGEGWKDRVNVYM